MAAALRPAERRDWLRLSLSENVGPHTFRKLIARYGSPGAAIAALPELSRKGGLSRPLRICGADQADAHLEKAASLGQRMAIGVDDDYPALLREIDGAPPVVWVKGDLGQARPTAVAVVGSRNASAAGLRFTRMLAAGLGEAGRPVVSGLARGIDTAAHEAALATGTVAVLAGGLDVVYPPENAKLHAAIAERGALLTEMTPGTVPRAEHFPRRNRIISGIAQGTVVVEAALRSGSLITARLAAEQGRDVFAVPGSPLDPRTEGTNRLIREGATLVTSAAQVIEGLGLGSLAAHGPLMFTEAERHAGEEPAPPGPAAQDRILELLSPTPVEVDDLIREGRLSSAVVTGILLELELAGRIVRSSGGRVALA